MKLIPTAIKSFFSGSRTLDGSPVYAVAQEPVQWWQKWTDGERKPYNDSVAAAESAMDAYAQSFALMPGHLYEHLGNGGKENMGNVAINRLLRNPNSYQSSSDFKLFLGRQLMQYGNAYAVAIRNGRNEVETLHPIAAGSCQPVIEAESKALFYSVRANPLMDGEVTFMIPARDVLHVKLYTPWHPLIGVSPLTYAAATMSANAALSGHMAKFFNNMARPSFILSTDANLTKEQMNQLRTAWNDQSKQMDSGGVPILAGGLKSQQLSLTSQDSQLIEAFRLTVEDIGRAFRIPLPLMGVSTTYASTEALMGFWLSTGLGFFINHIETAMDKFFELPADQFIEFDTEQLLRVDFAARVEGLAKATGNGIMSPNEARARLELPSVENGDVPTMQQQQVPINLLSELHASAISAKMNPPAAAPVEEDSSEDDSEDDSSDVNSDESRGSDPEITKAMVINLLHKKRAA